MRVDHSTFEFYRFVRRAFGAALCIALVGLESVSFADDGFKLLPKPELKGSMSVEEALAGRRSTRSFDTTPLALATVSQLLWAAQGITNERGFRTAPSAGALFPLEIYLVVGAVSDLAPGVYHYDPKVHRLLRVLESDLRKDLAKASAGQDWMMDAPAILILAASYDRTARRYGVRAARYVQMEVGHVSQNIYLQSTSLDVGACLVGAFDDASVKALLDLPDEVEPVGLMPIGNRRGKSVRE
jgi:SagB-type dehydrogenase family enzyme